MNTDRVSTRDELVADGIRKFFDASPEHHSLYFEYQRQKIRPRILEFWFLRFCPLHMVCVPRSIDGVMTPVATLYRHRLASFHKEFFSITRIPRRDASREVQLVLNLCDGSDGAGTKVCVAHTLAEWNVIRFLLEGGGVALKCFIDSRGEVEQACRTHRRLGGQASASGRRVNARMIKSAVSSDVRDNDADIAAARNCV